MDSDTLQRYSRLLMVLGGVLELSGSIQATFYFVYQSGMWIMGIALLLGVIALGLSTDGTEPAD